MRAIHESRYTVYDLDRTEQKKQLYEYTVTGWGAFPWDMLRFDCAWPVSGIDADRMANEREPFSRRTVKLHSYRKPTVDRWSSFTWSVGSPRSE